MINKLMSSELLVKTAQDKIRGFRLSLFLLVLTFMSQLFSLVLMIMLVISPMPTRFQFRFRAQSTDAACLLFCDLQEK